MFKKIPNLYNENIKARAIAVQILADKEAALKASIESLSKTKNFKVTKSSKKRKLDTKQNINKRENFKRLANNRIKNTLKQIKLISNLSNKRTYFYSDLEGQEIIKKISKQLKINIKNLSKMNNEEPKFMFGFNEM